MRNLLWLVPALLAAQVETLTPVQPGIWFREGDLKKYGHCNNAVIEMKDYLVVVDANFPSGAEALLRDIRKVSAKPVKYVLLTHHHGDHAYGSAVWTKAGAITVAHQNVVDEIKRYEPKRWRADIAARKDVAALRTDNLELPKETFTKSPWRISDGTRTVELHHFGWGHTRGDGYVYLPKERVLVTGDAIVNGAYNFTADANLANWPKILDRVLGLKINRVLPGHGVMGGPEVIRGQRDFLLLLRAAVEKDVKAGRKLEEIRPELPASVKNWIGEPFRSQVRDAYREITEKKPAGDLEH